AGPSIPNLQVSTGVSRDQAASVGAERHGGVWRGGFLPLGLDLEDFPSGPRIPDLDGLQRTIEAQRGDALAVGLPGDAEDNLIVAGKINPHPAGRHVPDLDGRVVAGGSNPLAVVGAERDAADFMAVPGEGQELRTFIPPERGRIPEADGPVGAGGGEAPAVRAERHAAAPTGMSAQAEHLAAGRRVPEAHRLVF